MSDISDISDTSDTSDAIISASFRDPCGFLFLRDNILYRQVNITYKENYLRLMDSGLYKRLVQEKLLVPHEEMAIPFCRDRENEGYKVLKPEKISFISYPYEWCFSQLKDAALTIIQIQKLAFEKGMILKDSSAYNIQFHRGKPVLIDTLSFEIYKEGEPWVAYGQFCRHFLAPLALMSYKDVRLNQLARIYIDGIPLDLAISLLPFSSRLSMSLYMHIFLHGWSQNRYENKALAPTSPANSRNVSRLGFQGIIASLEKAVKKLEWKPGGTEWDNYYTATNYSPAALEHKKEILSGYIDRAIPGGVWDLGANTGLFSRIATNKGIPTVAFDIDPSAVEKNYLVAKEKGETLLLPLLQDLTNPSPGIGWDNRERTSFLGRGPVDLIFCLALVHHLAIANNVPLGRIALFLSRLCRFLVLEFIPKDDSQVQRLLATREDVFPTYTKESFEEEFSRYFNILDSILIKDSKRALYLLKKK